VRPEKNRLRIGQLNECCKGRGNHDGEAGTEQPVAAAQEQRLPAV
jgi:hypothetical protein